MHLIVCVFIAVKMDIVQTNFLIEMALERIQSRKVQVRIMLKDVSIVEKLGIELLNVGIVKQIKIKGLPDSKSWEQGPRKKSVQ